jgi:hypothetical protein
MQTFIHAGQFVSLIQTKAYYFVNNEQQEKSQRSGVHHSHPDPQGLNA